MHEIICLIIHLSSFSRTLQAMKYKKVKVFERAINKMNYRASSTLIRITWRALSRLTSSLTMSTLTPLDVDMRRSL